jgi:hypothetical protein
MDDGPDKVHFFILWLSMALVYDNNEYGDGVDFSALADQESLLQSEKKSEALKDMMMVETESSAWHPSTTLISK